MNTWPRSISLCFKQTLATAAALLTSSPAAHQSLESASESCRAARRASPSAQHAITSVRQALRCFSRKQAAAWDAASQCKRKTWVYAFMHELEVMAAQGKEGISSEHLAALLPFPYSAEAVEAAHETISSTLARCMGWEEAFYEPLVVHSTFTSGSGSELMLPSNTSLASLMQHTADAALTTAEVQVQGHKSELGMSTQSEAPVFVPTACKPQSRRGSMSGSSASIPRCSASPSTPISILSVASSSGSSSYASSLTAQANHPIWRHGGRDEPCGWSHNWAEQALSSATWQCTG